MFYITFRGLNTTVRSMQAVGEIDKETADQVILIAEPLKAGATWHFTASKIKEQVTDGAKIIKKIESDAAMYKKIFWLLFSYQGRVSRKVFWLYLLTAWLSFIVMGVLFVIVSEHLPILLGIPIRFLLVIIFLILVYAQLPITVKRLHDIDCSGWWVILFMIPLLGIVFALVTCGRIPGTKGENRYGKLGL